MYDLRVPRVIAMCVCTVSDCQQNAFFTFSRQNKFFQLNDFFTSDQSLLNSGSEYAIKSFNSQSSLKMWFVEVYNIMIRTVYENDF